MSYTFAGTGDDITASVGLSMCDDGRVALVCGWWYPTTLTATRGYWSVGATFGAEVDTTTSDIRMRTDNTTDGQWLASPCLITVNKWWFIAWLVATENTTVPGAWRVWVGDAERPPTEVPVTNPTVRVGNYTPASAFFIGNKGTATLAFQGDVGWVSCLNLNGPAINNAFTVATSGVIADDQAENTLKRWVLDLWMGRPNLTRFSTLYVTSTDFHVAHFALDPGALLLQWSHRLEPNSQVVPTINGATYTSHAPPTRPPANWPHLAPYVRR